MLKASFYSISRGTVYIYVSDFAQGPCPFAAHPHAQVAGKILFIPFHSFQTFRSTGDGDGTTTGDGDVTTTADGAALPPTGDGNGARPKATAMARPLCGRRGGRRRHGWRQTAALAPMRSTSRAVRTCQSAASSRVSQCDQDEQAIGREDSVHGRAEFAHALP